MRTDRPQTHRVIGKPAQRREHPGTAEMSSGLSIKLATQTGKCIDGRHLRSGGEKQPRRKTGFRGDFAAERAEDRGEESKKADNQPFS